MFDFYEAVWIAHKAIFPGNLEAPWLSWYQSTLVAHKTFFKHCLMIHKKNM